MNRFNVLIMVGLILVGNYLLTSKAFAQCATGATCTPNCNSSCNYSTCESELTNPISVIKTQVWSNHPGTPPSCVGQPSQVVDHLPFTDYLSASHNALPITSGANFAWCHTYTNPAVNCASTGQECQTSTGLCCTGESDAAFCSNNSYVCGSLTTSDNCGVSRTVGSCGTCGSYQTCLSGACECTYSNCFGACCSSTQTECNTSTNACCTPTTCTATYQCGSSAGTDNCGHACNYATVGTCSGPGACCAATGSCSTTDLCGTCGGSVHTITCDPNTGINTCGNNCLVNGGWSGPSPACPGGCSDNFATQTKTCNNPTPKNGGSYCTTDGGATCTVSGGSGCATETVPCPFHGGSGSTSPNIFDSLGNVIGTVTETFSCVGSASSCDGGSCNPGDVASNTGCNYSGCAPIVPGQTDQCTQQSNCCNCTYGPAGCGPCNACPPSCAGKTCGASDGCNGICHAGSGCCTPACSGKNCGSDGCGGSCGSCSGNNTCGGGGSAGVCGCTPATTCSGGATCGTQPDGCGGTVSCGSCPVVAGVYCNAGTCACDQSNATYSWAGCGACGFPADEACVTFSCGPNLEEDTNGYCHCQASGGTWNGSSCDP